jgi:hypothetical protein
VKKNSAAEEIDLVRRAVFVPRLSVHLRMKFIAGKRALFRCAETSFSQLHCKGTAISTRYQIWGFELGRFSAPIGPIFASILY